MFEKNNIGWSFWNYKKINQGDGGRAVAVYNQPKYWDKVVAFAAAPRTNYNEIYAKRPNFEIIREAFDSLLENVRIENCKIDEEFLSALGLGEQF